MNVLQRIGHSLGRTMGTAVKAFSMAWGTFTQSWYWSTTGLGRTSYGYGSFVGEGRGNAIVMSVVFWLCRTFPEAPIRVQERQRDGALEPNATHPMVRLLDRPNPYYSGVLLWMATLADWMLTGNAYWVKIRSSAGKVVELYWLPAGMVEPRWDEDGSEYLTHYEYSVNGDRKKLEPEDVVHFRYGLDPANVRKGLSPLATLLREVFTDDEAANYTASLLKNMGIPGVIVSPDGDLGPSRDDLERAKAEYEAKFGGDNRGRALFMSGKTKVDVLTFNPQQMDLKQLRRIPEERVTAVFGLPAVVVGLGAGLDRSTFANFKEAREAAYESNVIPTQRLLAAEIATQLLPEFEAAEDAIVDFDLSQVRVLQEDQDALFKRAGQAVRDGLIKQNEGRQMIGFDQDPDGDVWLLPMSVVAIAAGDLATPPPALPAPRATITEVPPEKSLPGPETKAQSADAVFQRAMLRQREQRARSLKGEIDAYFRGLAARTEDRYRERAGKMRELDGTKADREPQTWPVAVKAEDIIPEEEARGLVAILRGSAEAIGEATFELASDRLGTEIAWDLQNPNVTAYLSLSSERVQGIMDTTRADLRKALQDGEAAGEGISQLAKRVREVVEESYKGRGETIARTEVGTSQQRAAILGYRESGVVSKVRVLDGTDHDDECRAANGQAWELEYADARPLQHPRCTRCFVPLVAEG